MKHRFILLEGIDGAGKTSVGKYLQETYGFSYIETPGEEFEVLKSYIGKRDSLTRLAYYFAGNFDASAKIRELLKKNTVVCDRYFYSTLVYFSLYTGKEINETYEIVKGLLKHVLKPDIILLLHLDKETKKTRLQEKMEDYSDSEYTDKFLFEDLSRAEKVERLYMEYFDYLADESHYNLVDSSKGLPLTVHRIKLILKKEGVI